MLATAGGHARRPTASPHGGRQAAPCTDDPSPLRVRSGVVPTASAQFDAGEIGGGGRGSAGSGDVGHGSTPAFGEQEYEVHAATGVQGDGADGLQGYGSDGLQGDGGDASEHVEDGAAAFGEQGEQGDATTEGGQGASTNGAGASGHS